MGALSSGSPDYNQEDYLLAVGAGKIEGHSIFYAHGFSDVASTDNRMIHPSSDEYFFKDTPSTLYLTSSDDTDTQVVTLDWLNEDYLPVTSSVTLQGQTPVEIGLGIRVNKAFTTDVTATIGSVFVSNALSHTDGVPEIEDTVMCYLPGPQTRTMALFTVPDGHTAFGFKGFFSSSKGKDCDFYWNTRNPYIPIPPTQTKVLSVYQNTIEVDFGCTKIEARSDAWFSVVSSIGNSKVSTRVIVVVVDNNFLV